MNIAHLGASRLVRYEAPIALQEEQHRIVAYLDSLKAQVDKLTVKGWTSVDSGASVIQQFDG